MYFLQHADYESSLFGQLLKFITYVLKCKGNVTGANLCTIHINYRLKLLRVICWIRRVGVVRCDTSRTQSFSESGEKEETCALSFNLIVALKQTFQNENCNCFLTCSNKLHVNILSSPFSTQSRGYV